MVSAAVRLMAVGATERWGVEVAEKDVVVLVW